MNRTQRAIRKQLREAEAEKRVLKKNEIVKRKSATDTFLFNKKSQSAEKVNAFWKEEKECRLNTREHKKQILSEKKTKELVGA